MATLNTTPKNIQETDVEIGESPLNKILFYLILILIAVVLVESSSR